jgi:hypothetical protein
MAVTILGECSPLQVLSHSGRWNPCHLTLDETLKPHNSHIFFHMHIFISRCPKSHHTTSQPLLTIYLPANDHGYAVSIWEIYSPPRIRSKSEFIHELVTRNLVIPILLKPLHNSVQPTRDNFWFVRLDLALLNPHREFLIEFGTEFVIVFACL